MYFLILWHKFNSHFTSEVTNGCMFSLTVGLLKAEHSNFVDATQ